MEKNRRLNIHALIAFALSIIMIPVFMIWVSEESDSLGFISLSVLIFIIIFSIISLGKIKKRSNKGQGLAITAIVISSLLFFFLIIFDIQSYIDEKAEINSQQQTERNLEIDNLKDKLSELENRKPQVINKTTTNEPNLASLIEEWTPKVGYMICRWNASETMALGSFVLNKVKEYGNTVITNRHVLSDDFGNVPNKCVLVVNNKEYTIPWAENTYFLGNEEDFGYVKTSIPSETISVCGGNKLSNPKIGDKVVILGYPGIGSQSSITATEGIISGVEKNYYVTSAKIEAGNSGGAAILVKDNCYLGIPSYVQVGEAETLGRILKASLILKF